jgi:hypothetical protein
LKQSQIRGFAPFGIVECWNNGIMGFGIMQYWVNGKKCVDDKIKTGEYPFKNQPCSIPVFQYSIFEASVKPSKNIIYFH